MRGIFADTIADALYFCGASSIDGDNDFGDQGVSVYTHGQWDTLGVFNGEPFSAVRWNDTLIVAGSFIDVNGDTSVRKCAFWDSSGWHAYGVFPQLANGDVEDLKVIDGELYMIGTFDVVDGDSCRGVAKRVGGAWQRVGSWNLLSWIILDLIEWNDTLYVTGNISFSSGSAHHIARLDGNEWQPLGPGIQGSFGQGRSLAVYQDELYVGGSIYIGAGNAGHGIMKWDGSQFLPVGTGLMGACGTYNCAAGATDMVVHDGILFVSGAFSYAGGQYTRHIATWDGVQWCSMPGDLQGPVDAIEFFHDTLYAGPNHNAEGVWVDCGARFIGTSYFDSCSGPMAVTTTSPPTEHLQAWWSSSNSIVVSGLPDGANELQIVDVMGKAVLAAQVAGTNDAHVKLAVPALSPGIYFIRVRGVGSVALGPVP